MPQVINPGGGGRRDSLSEILGTVLTGLSIAEKVHGLQTASEDRDILAKQRELEAEKERAQLEALQNQRKGVVNPAQQVELTEIGEFVSGPAGGTGPMPAGVVRFQTPEGSPLFWRAREARTPLQKVTTVDDQGNTVTKFIPETEAVNQTFRAPKPELTPAQQWAQMQAISAKEEKREIDERERGTPLGIARTREDAKIIKGGLEAKKTFDRKLAEMIELREKFGDTSDALLNRTAVERGKQLSKDLLLTYKNMAKLGVLSKADEDIINAIIPEDPLAFKLTGTGDEDPIINRLQGLRRDVNTDFDNTIDIRLDPKQRSQQAQSGDQKPQPPPNGNQLVEQDGVTYSWNGFEYVEAGG